MKRLKKQSWLAMLMAALLLASLPACSGKPAEPKTPETSESTPTGASQTEAAGASSDASTPGDASNPASQGGQNPGGKTTATNQKGTTTTVPKPTETVTVTYATQWPGEYNQPAGKNKIADLYTAAFKTIEQKYNVKIQIEGIDQNAIDIVARAINKGDAPYQIIEMQMAYVRTLARNGALLDLKTLKTLALNASQFTANKAVQENLTFHNKIYGTSFGYPELAMMGVFANTSILKAQYKGTDIKTLYKNGQWTWENFANIARDVTKNIGSPAELYGIGCDGTTIGMAIAANCGGTVTRSGNSYISQMPSAKGIDAMNWIRTLLHDNNSLKVYSANLVSQGYADFAAGKFVFLPTYLSHMNSFASTMEDDFTFLPFPKSTEGANYVTGVNDARMFCIPKTVKNADLIGQVMQELSTIGPKVTAEVENRYRNYGLDADGVRAAMEMTKYMQPEFARGVNFGTIDTKMNNAVFQRNQSPAQVMGEVKTQFEKLVSDYYAKFK